MAYNNPFSDEQLYFWQREKVGSDAEVDYLITHARHIIPIEVKAGPKGKLKSLYQFMQEKNSQFGIRISQTPLSFENKILSMPFYMIDQMHRLIQNPGLAE